MKSTHQVGRVEGKVGQSVVGEVSGKLRGRHNLGATGRVTADARVRDERVMLPARKTHWVRPISGFS